MKFSVIVPAYNASRFLHRCISSVQAQGVTDWELIIVDDGSEDGSAELLDAYAKEDPRIRVIHQKNTGQFLPEEGASTLRRETIFFSWTVMMRGCRIVCDASDCDS